MTPRATLGLARLADSAYTPRDEALRDDGALDGTFPRHGCSARGLVQGFAAVVLPCGPFRQGSAGTHVLRLRRLTDLQKASKN